MTADELRALAETLEHECALRLIAGGKNHEEAQACEQAADYLRAQADALRLAVALGRSDMVLIEIGRTWASVEFDSSEVCALETGDTNVAIRRVIVRAAAEIGRQHD